MICRKRCRLLEDIMVVVQYTYIVSEENKIIFFKTQTSGRGVDKDGSSRKLHENNINTRDTLTYATHISMNVQNSRKFSKLLRLGLR